MKGSAWISTSKIAGVMVSPQEGGWNSVAAAATKPAPSQNQPALPIPITTPFWPLPVAYLFQ